MMSCEELRRDAAGVAALPAEDPLRVTARAHARGCATCAAALKEGERLFELLGAAPIPPPPMDVLRRVSASVLADRGPAPQVARGRWPWIALATVVAWALVAMVARDRAHDAASWVASVGVAVLAVVAGAAAHGRWGRPAAGAMALVSLSLVALAGAGGGFFASIGVKCVALELLAAAAPLGTTAWLARSASPTPGTFIGAAAAGALAGHAALHLTCPVRAATPHLLAFHTGGIVLAAAIGFCVTRVALPRAAAR